MTGRGLKSKKETRLRLFNRHLSQQGLLFVEGSGQSAGCAAGTTRLDGVSPSPQQVSTSPGIVRTPSIVLHFSCGHDSFVGIVAGLRFGRYRDRRGPPHRVCAADIATAASTGVDPHPRREPRTDNPHFPRKRLWVLIPRNASSRKEMTCSGTSGAFRPAWTWFPVCRGPERVWRQGKRVSVSGAAKNLVAECVRSFQWKDGQNYA